MKKYLVVLIISFSLLPTILLAQNKADVLLAKLNKVHKENRVLGEGVINEIFINKTAKTLDIDNYRIPLSNYTAYFENSYNSFHKKNMNITYFKCLDGSHCIIDSKTHEDNKAVGFYFKSKKACYDFMNLIDEIKQALTIL